MARKYFTEHVVEQAALAWLEALGYDVLSGPEIAPGELAAEREEYGQVILERRLRQALELLNAHVPADAIEEAFRKLTRPDSPSLVGNNHVVHTYLVEGVPVEYQRPDSSIGGDLVRVLDYDNPENNECLAVNQFTVIEDQHERRPDVVVFVNGLPLGRHRTEERGRRERDDLDAFNQLQTYKQQIPSLFTYNELLVISDGLQARIGTLTADRERFMPWRTIAGEERRAATRLPQLQVLLRGVFREAAVPGPDPAFHRVRGRRRRGARQKDGRLSPVPRRQPGALRKLCGPARSPLRLSQRSGGNVGDRRVGVVWHTQGSARA